MKRTICRLLLIGLGGVLPLLALLPADASAVPPSDRTRWMAGIGFLVGQAQIDNTLGVDANWTSGITPQFRFGHMLIRQRLLLSFENKQWTDEQGERPPEAAPPDTKFLKFQAGSQIFALALTAFPGNPENLWGGLYFSAGAGPANVRLDYALVDTLGTGEDPPEVVDIEWGWGYYLGGGYEFRFLPYVAAGLSLSYIYSSIEGDLVNKSQVWPVAFTLNWYF